MARRIRPTLAAFLSLSAAATLSLSALADGSSPSPTPTPPQVVVQNPAAHAATTPPAVAASRTSVALSTIARSGRKPGDPIINAPGAVRGVAYQSLTNGKPVNAQALFGRALRPRGSEADQGHAGDCYLISTMAVYAQFHPETIKSVFLKPDGSLRLSPGGRPAARYFEHNPETNTFHPADATVYDGRAPVRVASERLPFAKEVHHKIWGPMVEYTYTKFRDEAGGAAHSTNANQDRTGMNRTANGGYPNHVMRALTGKDAETVKVDLHHEDQVWNKFLQAQSQNKVIVVGSTMKTTLRGRVHDEIHDGHLKAEEATDMKFDEDKWVSTHAYSVWGDKDHPFVFEKNGERFIRLRNPWGDSAPGVGGEKGDEGIAVIPFKQFLMRYDRAWIGESAPMSQAVSQQAAN